jgi:O-antigen/teichoic acid export membrane protein
MKILRSNLSAGLADQAVVSFGNFALSVSLAHILPVAEFGIYSVTMSFLLFFNTLHQAFIIYPLSVRTAGTPPRMHARLLRMAVLLTLPCALPFILILGAALWSIGRLSLLPVASAALLAWQLQEVLRRSLIVRNRLTSAILIDGVRYLGPVIVVVAFSSRIVVTDAYLAIALLSIVSVLPLVRLLWRPDAALRRIPLELSDHWRLAMPVLGANLLAVFSTQWFLWLLAWRHTPDAAASLVALTNVVAIASPVMLAAENILVPEIARTRHRLTFADLMRVVGRHCLLCIALVTPFFLAIAVFPRQVLGLIYGHSSPYATHVGALEMLAGVYVCFLLSYILAATLRGYRAGAAVFSMQLYPAILGLTLGSWLTLRFGLNGAALASLLAGLLRVAMGSFHVLRLRGETAPPQAMLAVP